MVRETRDITQERGDRRRTLLFCVNEGGYDITHTHTRAFCSRGSSYCVRAPCWTYGDVPIHVRTTEDESY